jgi:methionyl-tRNA formyltransferase
MRVLFIGTGDIGLPVLRWLMETTEHELVGVVSQQDKPVGRDQRIQAPPIKAAVSGRAVPVLQPRRIKHDDAVAEIAALRAEVIVVMAYGQILPRSVLELSPRGCLNLHASLLPKHRGAAPIQAAITAGDTETGITVMYMDEGLDTGDILLQSRIPIAPDETGGSLHDRLAKIAPAALADALRQVAAGTAPRTPQNNAEATYAPKLEREHGLIDWSQSAEVIERKIRAFDPWPGSYTMLRDEKGRERKLKIFRVEIIGDDAVPVGVTRASDAGLLVGASGAALLLRDVQLEGKKRMSAADLLRGHAWIASASIRSEV